jgi:UDP-N-acetylglucosamine 4,6-dehydratase
MTRFWLTLDDGVKFVISCIETMVGGEVFVPKIPSMNILDLAEAIAPGCEIDMTGIRPGEKMHEALISEDESRHTREAEDRFIVIPEQAWWWIHEAEKFGELLPSGFKYMSNDNPDWLSVEDLRALAGEF